MSEETLQRANTFPRTSPRRNYNDDNGNGNPFNTKLECILCNKTMSCITNEHKCEMRKDINIYNNNNIIVIEYQNSF